jgi:hypothetical protein
MFPDPKPKSRLEVAIDDVLDEMAHHHTTTQEYGQLLERLTALHKLREKPQRPSPDVIIQSATYILGVALVLRHEEFNIITTKALGFLPRIR